MSNYTINYIVYTPGHRHHHAGSQTNLLQPGGGPLVPGAPFSVFAPDSLPYMGGQVPFAFMSVVGNADDHHLYTNSGTQSVLAGSGNIKITVVYAPAGGGDGHGGPGVWVDAFNVDTGDFSDSDFMQVYTNGVLDNAKTATANNDGIVSSATAEDMRSYAMVDGVPFLQWEKVGGPNVTNLDYMLADQEGGIIFAFYQTPSQPSIPKPHVDELAGWIYVSPGVLVDAGGFVIGPDGKPHPVGPWGELFAKLVTTIAILSLASNLSKKEKELAINLAVAHLDTVKKSISAMEIKHSPTKG